jgi:hypothetical protein
MSVASHLGEQAAALVDGELDHDARDRTLVHLTSCASCRAEVDAMRQLKARLATLSDPGPSAALMRRLLDVGAPPRTGSLDSFDSFGPFGPFGSGGQGSHPGPGRSSVTPGSFGTGGRGSLLGPAASRANAVLQRRRPAVRLARAAVRAGVRLAVNRQGAILVGGRRPDATRPRQRARLAAVGCFSIMIVAMGTAFTMGGQASSRPLPQPIADGAGVDHDPKQDSAGVDPPLPSTQSASAAGTWSDAPLGPPPARASPAAGSSTPVIGTVEYPARVKPDARALAARAGYQFTGAEYLADCRENQRRPGIGPTAESRTLSTSPGWSSLQYFAAFCGAQLRPLGPSGESVLSLWSSAE